MQVIGCSKKFDKRCCDVLHERVSVLVGVTAAPSAGRLVYDTCIWKEVSKAAHTLEMSQMIIFTDAQHRNQNLICWVIWV